ncbi:MAG TPA: Rieske 2Fe-2S domain-containing protein [Candidatus Hydrogenedentes bacterium]|nr:Rieske 2Fe-2S domain-containing protein [Candidatus Hydrogenedentota bacterium]HNT89096.1 Rieske 2Fe-2S domain-containing protein [Candidatus Hydrogenedentota bacterium]
MALIKAGKASELPPGMARCVSHGNAPIAVFNIGGAFYACDDTCPHAGGSLHEGFVEGTTVTCPWHGWAFDLAAAPKAPWDGVRRYRVIVEGDLLQVEVPD